MTDFTRRDPGYPGVFIRAITVDMNEQYALLDWSGTPARPLRRIRCSTGSGTVDPETRIDRCLDEAFSRRSGSGCTPIGTRTVHSIQDHLSQHPACLFVTWFHFDRRIAFHSHTVLLPRRSSGCVRVALSHAHTIHNNVIPNQTSVRVRYDSHAPALHPRGADR